MKGASPVELGRNLRADQWARFCGRHTTADVIEQYARNKLLERSTTSKWMIDNVESATENLRTKTIPADTSRTDSKLFKNHIV